MEKTITQKLSSGKMVDEVMLMDCALKLNIQRRASRIFGYIGGFMLAVLIDYVIISIAMDIET